MQSVIQKLSYRLLGFQQGWVIFCNPHEPSDHRNRKLRLCLVKVNSFGSRAEYVHDHVGVAVDIFPSTDDRDHGERKIKTGQVEDLAIAHLARGRGGRRCQYARLKLSL